MASSAAPVTPLINEKHADELTSAVIERLRPKYGQDLSLLVNPSAPGTDGAKLCAMVADLYREVLALPEANSARCFSARCFQAPRSAEVFF
jgi:hypothetical protein